MAEKKGFSLVDLPDYVYPLGIACPSCYKPLYSRSRVDGRCEECLHSKDILPVNFRRRPKRKDEDEEELVYTDE